LAGVRDDPFERDLADGRRRSRGEQADDARLGIALLLENARARLAERFLKQRW
jgi:hypothetical protein